MRQHCITTYIDYDSVFKICPYCKTQVLPCSSMSEIKKALIQIKNDRDLIKSGGWPSTCQTCKTILNVNNQRGDTTENSRGLALRLSNLCNLSCAMCGWMESSTKVHQYFGSNDILRINNRHYDFITDTITNWINEGRDIYVNLAGGEPLLEPLNYEFIEKFGDGIKIISFTSNLSNNLKKILPYLKKNPKKFKFEVSIEGDRYWNAMIRTGSNYDLILKNLKEINDIGCVVTITTVISNYNIFHLADTAVQPFAEIYDTLKIDSHQYSPDAIRFFANQPSVDNLLWGDTIFNNLRRETQKLDNKETMRRKRHMIKVLYHPTFDNLRTRLMEYYPELLSSTSKEEALALNI